MTKEQALALAATEWWNHATDREIAEFQLVEPLLCMPFGRFHEAIEKTLGRPVFTHEFGSRGHEQLRAELFNGAEPPTLDAILNLIPAEKRIVIHIPERES